MSCFGQSFMECQAKGQIHLQVHPLLHCIFHMRLFGSISNLKSGICLQEVKHYFSMPSFFYHKLNTVVAAKLLALFFLFDELLFGFYFFEIGM